MIIYLFFWLGLMQLNSVQPHAVYISVIDIRHEVSSDQASFVIKVFTNDFEDALYNHSDKRLQLSNADACDLNNAVISSYFEKHLQIQVNGKETVYRFAGCEINDDSIWLTFSMTCMANWNDFSIKADYLMELFPTQTNIVNLHESGEKRFLKLTLDEKEGRIDF